MSKINMFLKTPLIALMWLLGLIAFVWFEVLVMGAVTMVLYSSGELYFSLWFLCCSPFIGSASVVLYKVTKRYTIGFICGMRGDF